MKSKYQSWDNPRCEILKAMSEHLPMSKNLCLICKGGRLLCGRQTCPLIKKFLIQEPLQHKISTLMFGKSPSIFVGWKNYPNIFVGPLTSLDNEKVEIADNPSLLYSSNFDEIIKIRSLLVRGMFRQNVREISNFSQKNKEIALSVKPIDIETKFKSLPEFKISFSPISQPMGPTGELTDLRIAENPKIPKGVDEVIDENLNVTNTLKILHEERNFDIYYLIKAFSSGAFGMKEKRLVPTRWSITATDDILGKIFIKEIKEYEKIAEITVFSNTYLFNHFEILLIPGNWEFEQFEAWAPETLWTKGITDYAINLEAEYYKGRNDYAIKEGGGYYAARFAVLEYLRKIKKQARVIIFREIYEGYIMPVGVWEVRENVRNAFKNKERKFSNIHDALNDMAKYLKVPMREYLKRSEIMVQKRLDIGPF
ncbi:MAG: hypothetical protein CVT88_08815 [Candidatus Altiarchaeales archaeon HGW-Altiarchaeales-1]|nr:MAG: hypothetical protein CVT88_08815 [Candidatus Altiarchaeales archaeon HGW-Altiarchaeales-1]